MDFSFLGFVSNNFWPGSRGNKIEMSMNPTCRPALREQDKMKASAKPSRKKNATAFSLLVLVDGW